MLLNNQEYEVNIKYKKVKNINIRIISPGIILVTCPKRTSNHEINEILEKNHLWIEKTIKKYIGKKEGFLLNGISYPIVFSDHNYFDGTTVYLINNNVSNIKNLLDQYAFHIFDLFEEILKKYEIKDTALSLKYYKSRWGCCKYKSREIILNKYLIQLSDELIMSVMMHEISHLFVHDHSNKFYEVLKQYDVSYKEHRKELKDYAYILK